jgi:hypothetical protein
MKFVVGGLDFKASLRLKGQVSWQLILVSMLVGNGSINGTSQNIDYSAIPATPQTTAKSALSNFFRRYSVGRSAQSFNKVAISDNRKFFQELLCEFGHYFVKAKRGEHAAAFILLYRIMERLSYTAPLIYCRTATDYYKTFGSLRDLITNDKTTELTFLQNFLKSGKLIDGSLLSTRFTITFSNYHGRGDVHFDALKKAFSNFAIEDKSRWQLTILLADICKLLVDVRNRFAHFASGGWQENISLADIEDADEFFGALNPVFCSFLSFFVLHVIAQTYKK